MPRGRRKKAFKIKLKKTTLYTLSSVGLLAVGGLIILSFSRQGPVLNRLFTTLSHYLGWGMVFLPFLLVVAGLMLARLKWKVTQPNVFAGGILVAIAIIGLTRSGAMGFEIWHNLAALVTGFGALIILGGLTFAGLVITFNTSLEEILLFLIQFYASVKNNFFNKKARKKFQFSDARQKALTPGDRQKPSESKSGEPEPSLKPALASGIPGEQQVWEYPPLSILSDSLGGKADRGDLKKNAEVIERTLESFGIAANVAEVNLGPAVTQYALEIALGTKLSKITALANDLALALAAPTGQIRIEAPIPGRSLVGVEVPNRSPEFVTLGKMMTSDKMKKAGSKLTVSLGLNVAGEPVLADIGRMPHVLIAGATGSGKTVCINSFIATLLFRASPAELKLILIDPKRVELTNYNGIPHLLTPVIYEPEQVLSSLKWAIAEMDRRYKLFAEAGVRNIEAYNELSGFAAFPYILIFIDELADIMLFAPAEVEDSICRIAQMARATGIHLVLSTQRPSVDVITGLIKANIPCRIAFSVSSQVDSRVIIDSSGAEKLLGRGDMLYIPPDQAKPTRIQGTFVSDAEIKKLIDHLKKSGTAPVYTEEVTQAPAGAKAGGGEVEEKDELFEEAVRTICRYDRASASLLQRRLRVGYARAARILDQLERAGIVSPAEGSKPREVLVKNPEEFLASSANN
jgi:S-DNA-T family DNA segregation ATPase FtsK/SpoIIIE